MQVGLWLMLTQTQEVWEGVESHHVRVHQVLKTISASVGFPATLTKFQKHIMCALNKSKDVKNLCLEILKHA